MGFEIGGPDLIGGMVNFIRKETFCVTLRTLRPGLALCSRWGPVLLHGGPGGHDA